MPSAMEVLQTVPGVGRSIAKKLVAAGYRTIDELAGTSPGELSSTLKIREELGDNLITAAKRIITHQAAMKGRSDLIVTLIDKISEKRNVMAVDIDEVELSIMGRKVVLNGKVTLGLTLLGKPK